MKETDGAQHAMSMTGLAALLSGRDPVVLVVDDQEPNLRLVGTVLTQAGYEVMPALTGEQALARVKARVPDVALLDMLMPGMDGFELAERLHNDERTADVPIIFLTASNEREGLVRAFESGAVDYLTKPFVAEELVARVRTHLELKLVRDHLSRIAREREELDALVAHDLKNPLSSIRFSAELLARDNPTADRVTQLADIILTSTDNALAFIHQYLERRAEAELLRKLERKPLRLDEAMRAALDRFAVQAQAKQMRLGARESEQVRVLADPTAVAHVIDHLLSNAIKFAPEGTEVTVAVGRGGPGMGRAVVMDRGPGLTRSEQQQLFRRFVRLSARPTATESASGLGLALAKQDVAQMGGNLWYEDRPEGGAVFAFELPLAP